MALTFYDEDHSENEDRWATVGRAQNGQILIVIHTWKCIDTDQVKIRIILARQADRDDTYNYENLIS